MDTLNLKPEQSNLAPFYAEIKKVSQSSEDEIKNYIQSLKIPQRKFRIDFVKDLIEPVETIKKETPNVNLLIRILDKWCETDFVSQLAPEYIEKLTNQFYQQIPWDTFKSLDIAKKLTHYSVSSHVVNELMMKKMIENFNIQVKNAKKIDALNQDRFGDYEGYGYFNDPLYPFTKVVQKFCADFFKFVPEEHKVFYNILKRNDLEIFKVFQNNEEVSWLFYHEFCAARENYHKNNHHKKNSKSYQKNEMIYKSNELTNLLGKNLISLNAYFISMAKEEIKMDATTIMSLVRNNYKNSYKNKNFDSIKNFWDSFKSWSDIEKQSVTINFTTYPAHFLMDGDDYHTTKTNLNFLTAISKSFEPYYAQKIFEDKRDSFSPNVAYYKDLNGNELKKIYNELCQLSVIKYSDYQQDVLLAKTKAYQGDREQFITDFKELSFVGPVNSSTQTQIKKNMAPYLMETENLQFGGVLKNINNKVDFSLGHLLIEHGILQRIVVQSAYLFGTLKEGNMAHDFDLNNQRIKTLKENNLLTDKELKDIFRNNINYFISNTTRSPEHVNNCIKFINDPEIGSGLLENYLIEAKKSSWKQYGYGNGSIWRTSSINELAKWASDPLQTQKMYFEVSDKQVEELFGTFSCKVFCNFKFNLTHLLLDNINPAQIDILSNSSSNLADKVLGNLKYFIILPKEQNTSEDREFREPSNIASLQIKSFELLIRLKDEFNMKPQKAILDEGWYEKAKEAIVGYKNTQNHEELKRFTEYCLMKKVFGTKIKEKQAPNMIRKNIL